MGRLRRILNPDGLDDRHVEFLREAAREKPAAEVDEVLAKYGLAGRLHDSRAVRRQLDRTQLSLLLGYIRKIGSEAQMRPAADDHCMLCGRKFPERDSPNTFSTMAVFVSEDKPMLTLSEGLGWIHTLCVTKTTERPYRYDRSYPAEIPEYIDGPLGHPQYFMWFVDYQNESLRVSQMPSDVPLPDLEGRQRTKTVVRDLVVGDVVHATRGGSYKYVFQSVSNIENREGADSYLISFTELSSGGSSQSFAFGGDVPMDVWRSSAGSGD